MLAWWMRLKGDEFYCESFTETIHIKKLWDNIDAFPISKEDVTFIYTQYEEPFLSDGKSAHSIIVNMLSEGYLTARYLESSDTVHINCWKLNTKIKDALFLWSKFYSKLDDTTKIVVNEFYKPMPISHKTFMSKLRYGQANISSKVLYLIKSRNIKFIVVDKLPLLNR